jgi:preprotein translocase subunit SecF
MLDIVGKRGWYFLIAALMIIPGLISMIIPPGWSTLDSGLKPGIDFTSGSVLDITFQEPVTQGQVQDRMDALGYPDALIQSTGSRSVLIRTKTLEEGSGAELSERERIQNDLEENVAPIALAATTVFILLYIWYAFRRAQKGYRYGISAILALLHDILITLGVFSILGRTIGMEVNATFIVGLLTVAGYSVNDTIVVFDRIRENVIRQPGRPFDALVNLSIIETLGRSLNTNFTVLLVLLAMLLIGGTSLRELLLSIFIGVAVGSYSSIFIASQFLVIWERGEFGKALRWGRRAPATAAGALLHLMGR